MRPRPAQQGFHCLLPGQPRSDTQHCLRQAAPVGSLDHLTGTCRFAFIACQPRRRALCAAPKQALNPSLLPDPRQLQYELDFRNEAANAAHLAACMAGRPDVAAPATYPALCTPRVLCMEWVEGCRLTDIECITQQGLEPRQVGRHRSERCRCSKSLGRTPHPDAPPHPLPILLYTRSRPPCGFCLTHSPPFCVHSRDPQVGILLLDAFAQSTFFCGWTHGDPHPGGSARPAGTPTFELRAGPRCAATALEGPMTAHDTPLVPGVALPAGPPGPWDCNNHVGCP